MNQYLLSVHSVEGEEREQPSPEEFQESMQRIIELEDDMEDKDVFAFGGRLHGPGAAKVVRKTDGDHAFTDGPFAETKEHIAGFYIINAAGLDDALEWASRVVDATGMPIEVRPFAATGRARM